MPRVLTVDDSRAVRAIIAKSLVEWGCEYAEAENGADGLAKLEAESFDVVLLDVTMPVMDGPEMLKQLRESGNKTPVIMLTAESKTSIVAGVLKLGINDYILKPFKPADLRAKMAKVVRFANAATDAAAPSAALLDGTPSGAVVDSRDASARQFTDVLVVDDMENVHKKLRSMLPAYITFSGCVSAQSALQACHERVFRVVLVDNVIPDVDSRGLMNQLRALQPHATFLSLCLRSSNDVEGDAKSQGFDGVLLKPFAVEIIEDFLQQYFDNQDLLNVDTNFLKPAVFSGREERLDRYFRRLQTLGTTALEQLASACFEVAVLDTSPLPRRADRTVRFVLDLDSQAKKLGLGLRLVGDADMKKLLRGFTETAAIPIFGTLAEVNENAA